ncbi:MAG TPA: PilT/PilU family type 4a pilus ATPase [Polyangiaceae bacterium]|nr:PilT/PilU family type 4a pilus ATPase [Polyangiaceae bacterium]
MDSPYGSESFLVQLLGKAVAAKASDVHLKVGQPPGARVRGELVYFRSEPLGPQDTDALAKLLVKRPEVRASIDTLLEHDTAYEAPGVGRFRVNVYRQKGSLAVVMRAIPLKIPTFEELGAPAASQYLAERDRGLVLVVGAAGNGKSSTLAAMIGHLNRTQPLHIVTIEDPIEFLHTDDKSSVSQREVGIDTMGFADALRAALRQDPDVILVGEIRDEITLDIALKAAETGHLVMSTLHTPDVGRTVGRMLALAPKGQPGSSDELRERIGDSLQGIIAQRLLPNKDGTGLVLAAEVLVATGTVRESIKRPENNPPMKELMEKGVHPYGMQTFEMHLKQLVQQGVLDKEVAKAAAGF